MYLNLFGIHLLCAISWVVFLLLLIKAIEYKSAEKVLYTCFSVFFMVVVLGVGTKMMLLNPSVAKSGNWLHVKLSFDIVLMIENIYLAYAVFKNKNISGRVLNWMFWFSYISFMIMVYLTIFRPI